MKTNINIEKALETLKNLKIVDEIAMISVAIIWSISDNKQTVQELANQLARQIKEEVEFNIHRRM